MAKRRRRQRVPESTLRGRAEQARGRRNELRALRIVLASLPPWADSARLSEPNSEEDHMGWDVVVSGPGVVAGLQVKSSWGQVRRRKASILRRVRGTRFAALAFVVVNKDRSDALVERDLRRLWWALRVRAKAVAAEVQGG